MNHRIQRTFTSNLSGVGVATEKWASLGLSMLSWAALFGGGLTAIVGSAVAWPLVPVGLIAAAGGAYGLYDIAKSGDDIGGGAAALLLLGGAVWFGGGAIWLLLGKGYE